MFRVAVWVATNSARPHDGEWKWGKPSAGLPYEYDTRQESEQAAALWGDSYKLYGLVRVVEGDKLPVNPPN